MAALERLLELVAEHTAFLDEMRGRWNPRDKIIVYAVLHALQLHAQAAIDYLLHACALLGLAAPTPTSCVARLAEEGLLGGHEADILKRMIRFRNIIVHEYGRVDLARVEGVLRSRGYARILAILKELHEALAERGVADP